MHRPHPRDVASPVGPSEPATQLSRTCGGLLLLSNLDAGHLQRLGVGGSDEPVVGTPSLVALSLFAVVAFVGAARGVRARPRLILAALAASVAFGVHNAMIGREVDYWGTFPPYQLTNGESFVMYATQALVFVGAAGMLAVFASRKLGPWVLPLVWAAVVGTAFEVSYGLSEVFRFPWVRVSHWDATELWAGRLALAFAWIWLLGRERPAGTMTAPPATEPK